MELFRAGEQDFLRLQDFYKNLIAKTPDMRQFCPWEYGVYPTDALLREHTHNGDLYYMERNGAILAALVLLPYQEENYAWDNPWLRWKMTRLPRFICWGLTRKCRGRGLLAGRWRQPSKKPEKWGRRLSGWMPFPAIFRRKSYIALWVLQK